MVLLPRVAAATCRGQSVPRSYALACRRVGATPEGLGPDRLEAVLEEISDGIRLFCPDDRFAEMMLALADLVE